MLHGAGKKIPTFTHPKKSLSFVGFYIPAPWVAYGIVVNHIPIGSMYGIYIHIYANIGGILLVNVTIYGSTVRIRHGIGPYMATLAGEIPMAWWPASAWSCPMNLAGLALNHPLKKHDSFTGGAG